MIRSNYNTKFLVAGLLIIMASCTYPDKQKIGTESVICYWEIEELLKQDIEPDSILWANLFETAGYKEFHKREFPAKWMKHYMQLGIKPSGRSEMEEWKAKGYYDYKFLEHFNKIKEETVLLKSFVQEVNDHGYIKRSKKLMMNYWPGKLPAADTIPVEFIFFDNDARGYNPILIDLAYARRLHQQGELDMLIAHEMHHYCRNRYLSFIAPADSIPESNIIWILNQVHAEGIADLIDKPEYFDNPLNAKSAKRYYTYLSETPVHISQMDSLLTAYAQPGSDKGRISEAIQWSAPNSGHPMGYFMATTIEKFLGKEALLEEIGNPFHFFRQYMLAINKSENEYPGFSDTSMALMYSLEERFRKD